MIDTKILSIEYGQYWFFFLIFTNYAIMQIMQFIKAFLYELLMSQKELIVICSIKRLSFN